MKKSFVKIVSLGLKIDACYWWRLLQEMPVCFFIFLFMKETLSQAHVGHMDTLKEIVLASMILKSAFFLHNIKQELLLCICSSI